MDCNNPANELSPATTTTNTNNNSEVPPSNEKELALLHQNAAVADGRMRLYAMVQDLEGQTEHFLKKIAEAKVIDKVRQKLLEKIGYDSYEGFVTSIDNVLQFYGTDNVQYKMIADFILKGMRFTGKPAINAVGAKFGMKQRLERVLAFFVQTPEPKSPKTLMECYGMRIVILEERREQLQAVKLELSTGLAIISQKGSELKEYLQQYGIHANSVLHELATLKAVVDEKIHIVSNLCQSFCQGYYLPNVIEFKQKMPLYEAEFRSTVENDAKNLTTYLKMLAALAKELSDAVLYFNGIIKFAEDEKSKLQKALSHLHLGASVFPNNHLQTVYVKKHSPLPSLLNQSMAHESMIPSTNYFTTWEDSNAKTPVADPPTNVTAYPNEIAYVEGMNFLFSG